MRCLVKVLGHYSCGTTSLPSWTVPSEANVVGTLFSTVYYTTHFVISGAAEYPPSGAQPAQWRPVGDHKMRFTEMIYCLAI